MLNFKLNVPSEARKNTENLGDLSDQVGGLLRTKTTTVGGWWTVLFDPRFC